MGPAPHPAIEPLAFLLGTWRGNGEGGYPTIEPFRYTERVTFEHVGDAFLLYSQWSWSADGETTPLHFERGFVRPTGSGGVELVLAHPIGVVEISEGTFAEGEIRLASREVRRTSTGDPVTALTRRYTIDGDLLRYELSMATEATPLMHHLSAELRRES